MKLPVILFAFAAIVSGATTPLRVAVGESTTLEGNSKQQTYSLSAAAGQTLLVELNVSSAAKSDEKDRIFVTAPGGKAVKSALDDTIDSHWIAALPAAGEYKIEISRPSGKPYDLRVTLMAPNDPRINCGLTPEKMGLGFTLQPYHPVMGGEMDEYWPAHILWAAGTAQLRIMLVEGVRKTFWLMPHVGAQLAKLQAGLQPGAKLPNPKDLLFTDFGDAAMASANQVQAVESPSFHGIRWVGYTSQDGPGKQPVYYAEALSKDGRYLLVLRAYLQKGEMSLADLDKLVRAQKLP